MQGRRVWHRPTMQRHGILVWAGWWSHRRVTATASYSHAPLRSSILRPHMLHRKTIMPRCWWKIQATRPSAIGSLVALAGIAKRNQYTYTNTYMYKHLHAHAHMHTHMHTCTHTCTHCNPARAILYPLHYPSIPAHPSDITKIHWKRLKCSYIYIYIHFHPLHHPSIRSSTHSITTHPALK